MHRHHNFYILDYIIVCTAASIFIEGHMRPYGRRLCTPGLHLQFFRKQVFKKFKKNIERSSNLLAYN